MRFLFASAAFAGIVAVSAAQAKSVSPASPVSPVTLAAAAILGADTPSSGWIEFVARIESSSPTAQKGLVEVRPTYSVHGSRALPLAQAPFHIPPGKIGVVRIPVRAPGSGGSVTLHVVADTGEALASKEVATGGVHGPLLVDLSSPSRIAIPLRKWPVSLAWSPNAYGTPTSEVGVGSPGVDRATGEPILPERAAGYSAASVVLVSSAVLARLEASQLDPLVGWVIAGGVLAVVPTRPEDLRQGVLPSLVNGTVSVTEPSSMLLKLPSMGRPAVSPSPFEPEPEPDDPTPDAVPPTPPTHDAGATPIQWIPTRTTPAPVGPRLGPGTAVKAKLVGYKGGALVSTDFGAMAPHGLGEVHLLAFDPTQAPGVDDPWVHGRMVELLTRAWDRRATTVFGQGQQDKRGANLNDVRRALDPNESFRPALGIAAILLIIYSIVAGPVTFLRATRRGRPLEPLLWAPLWSAAAFSLIVFVGFAGRGWRGRSRHLALVETSSSAARGTVRRYRAFFSSQTRDLAIRATDRACVLDVIETGREQGVPVLRLDKNGLSLGNLKALPWQTVIVQEEGLVDFGAGIALTTRPDHSVEVTNHTGRNLKDLLIYAPSSGTTLVRSLIEGASVA
ncbi:MAG: hypothetical protein WCI05_15830, partial [Myxococcales bacterium]